MGAGGFQVPIVPAAFARLFRRDFELEAKLHRGVGKSLQGIEGDGQTLGNVVEREADLEAGVGDDQVPELMLQDDRHFFRVLRAQA